MRGRACAAAAVLAVSSLDGFAGAGAQTPSDNATSQVSAPSIVLYPSDRSMTVTWEPPPDLPADAAVTYDIAWIATDDADEPDAEWNTVSGVPPSPAHRILNSSQIVNDTSYSVKMRAVTDRDGQWSAVAAGTTFERSGDQASRRSRPAIPFGVPVGGFQDFSGADQFNFSLTERSGVLVRTGGRARLHEVRSGTATRVGPLLRCPLAGRPMSSTARSTRSWILATTTSQCSVSTIALTSAITAAHGVQAEIVPMAGRSLDTALPLNVGEQMYGYFEQDYRGADWWRLDIADREFIDVHVTNYYRTFSDDGYLSLHDSAGARLESFRSPRRLQAELEAGTYYVKVSPSTAWGRSYALTRHVGQPWRDDVVTQCEALDRPEGMDDPLTGCQWHLDNWGQRGARSGEDANVTAAHAAGYLGAGVHVAVLDAGIELDHPDLAANTDNARSRSYCHWDPRPSGEHEDHGTAVAGVIAARDNSIGMRGVAPRAVLHNRRLICFSTASYSAIADALTREMDSICVSNSSWGAAHGIGASPTPYLFELAVNRGISEGCGGKGILYVFSAGNGAFVGDDSNLGELASYHAVTAVCAVNSRGARSRYSERGANLWVCGPTSAAQGRNQPGVATLTNYGRYRLDFGGTSSAAPVVAGVAALVRAANPELTWRDVKLILAASARQDPSTPQRLARGGRQVR